MKQLTLKARSAMAATSALVARVIHDLSMLPTRMHVTVVSLLFAFLGPSATAQGLTRLFSGWRGVVSMALELLLLVSVLYAAWGIFKGVAALIRKGQGRADEVEMREIFYPIVGGSLMAIIMYILVGMVEEAGGSSSDIGRNPIGR